MWDKIINHKTGLSVNINSIIGKKILKKYIKQLGGVDEFPDYDEFVSDDEFTDYDEFVSDDEFTDYDEFVSDDELGIDYELANCHLLSDIEYVKKEKLGEGYYSEVWNVDYSIDSEGNKINAVMKMFKNIDDKDLNTTILREINILKELKERELSLSIPKFYQCFRNSDNTQFGFFMEKINGIEINKYLNNKILLVESKDDVYNFIYELIDIHKKLISIIQKLHKKNIFHRDIHGGNIMYDIETNKITLIDFGHACTNTHISESRCKIGPTPLQLIYKKKDDPRYSLRDNDIILENMLTDYLGSYNFLMKYMYLINKKNLLNFNEKLRYLTLINGIIIYLYNKKAKYTDQDIQNMIEIISFKNTKINIYKEDDLKRMNIFELHKLGDKLGLYLDITNDKNSLIKEFLDSPIIIYNNIDKKIISKFTNNSMGCSINIKPPNKFINNKYRLNDKINIISVSIFKKGKILGQKYLLGFASLVHLFHKIYPNFILRIYYDSSISNDRYFNDFKLQLKLNEYVQLASYICPYQENNKHTDLFGTISRFFVLNENDVGNVFFRDIDFTPHKHDHDIMMNFIQSDAYLHQISFGGGNVNYGSLHSVRMNQKYPYILAGAWGVKNDILLKNNINLLADFIKIIKTQQDNIIKYTYKTTLDKFSYGTDEVILNLVIYENKRNFNFFCLNNKILVIFLKSLCEINHFNMFKQNKELYSLLNSENIFKESLGIRCKKLHNLIKKRQNHNIVNSMYNIVDKFYNNYQINIAWYEIILGYDNL